MAHITKYKQSQINNIINHDRREHTQGRENINNSLSYLNYNLCDRPQKEYLKELINKVKNSGGMVRENSIILGSVVITLPKTFLDNKTLREEFFKSSKLFLDEKFGKENCISAWVHLDEPGAQPHLHYKFCPIMKKQKKYKDGHTKEVFTFNAKQILNRELFQKFHNELSDRIEEELGFRTDILNGKTKKKGNRSIKQLKNENQNIDQKEYLNNLWSEYKELSLNFWNTYKQKRNIMKETAWELKRGIEQRQKEYEDGLNFIHNIFSKGLLIAIWELVGALIMLNGNMRLKDDLKALQSDLEALESRRRILSNHQEKAKKDLLKYDIEAAEKELDKIEYDFKTLCEDIREERRPKNIIIERDILEECR